MANFGSIVDWVLRLEDRTLAGKTVNLGDGAGWTRFSMTSKNGRGVPWEFWNDVMGAPRMNNDLALIVAKHFYWNEFWTPMQLTHLQNDELAATLMSFGVNDGVERATKLLQQALGLQVDGKLGPVTLAAVLKNDSAILASELRAAQENFYHAVVALHPDRLKDLAGWVKRARAVYPDLP